MRIKRDIFSISFNQKVCCVFSLEWPHLIIYHFQYKKENYATLSQICSNWILSKELKTEFETAVVNEPSVFEPLKVHCKL